MAIVSELDMVEETEEQLADLLVAEWILAMWALLDQYTGRLQLVNAIEAEKCVAFEALIWLCRHLIADDALKNVSAHVDRVDAGAVQFELRPWQGRE